MATTIRSKIGHRLAVSSPSPLYLNFLAPCLTYSPLKKTLSTSAVKRQLPISDASNTAQEDADAIRPDGRSDGNAVRTLSAVQRSYLDRALRVNQAGELAATLIYTAQTPVVVRGAPHLRPLMNHMYEQEAGHLKTFDELLAAHRVRPTALTPLWRVAATALGWGTAVISREAAMACTEAVETEIGEHYNGQVRELLSWVRDAEAHGEDVGEEIRRLVERIRVIRDEELEHLDEAVDEGAKLAEAYPVLSTLIRGGCRGAIWLSERV